ncbi:hypothetical protein HYW40_01610 [Candidatus Curtissbacteria bacterium]|nr:hypothetical protein [Candidatus Curtissbacteria bacterium]
MEATSHGLDQNRLACIDFEIGVLTNITHDHLDYHRTWENYALSKAKLFKKVRHSILNYDDRKSFRFLKNRAAGQITTYGIAAPAKINAKNFPLKLKIAGRHNLQNALAAAATTQILGISRQKIVSTLNNFSSPKGRMEKIDLGQNFKVIVDFAHTPNGLNHVLTTLKSQNSGRLIAVFGAAGERDSTKRPLMGKVADKDADVIILTAEDPRSEKVSDICDQIAQGIKAKTEGKNLFKIEDRQKAIEFAISLASQNDAVGLFGKGHEKSMCFGKKETPWNEFQVATQAVKRRLNAKAK